MLAFGNGGTINISGTFTATSAGDFDYGSILTAGKDISIKAQNIYRRENTTGYFSAPYTILFNATINGDNVKLHSTATSGLTLEGLKATGDVAINSDKSLALNGNIETDKNIELTAGTNLTSNTVGSLKADKQITIKADDVKLSGKVETSYKEYTSDKVEDLEKFLEEMPVIVVTTNKGLDMRNTANNFEGVYVDSDGEQINGSVLVTSNSDGFAVMIDKSVQNDITVKNNKSKGIILLLDKGTLQSLKGNITLEMDGDFLAGAALSANKDIKVTSRNGSMTIQSLDENNANDTLKAGKNINIKVANMLEVEGQVTAGRNITADTSGIKIVGKADVEAGNNIDLTAGDNGINIEGSVTSGNGNAAMTIEKGNLSIAGKLQARKGEIEIIVDEGNIQIGKDANNASDTVVANGNVNMTANKGTINVSGKVKSTSGGINVKANTGEKSTSNAATSYVEQRRNKLR